MSLRRFAALIALFACASLVGALVAPKRAAVRLRLTGEGDACRVILPRAMAAALGGYAGTFGVCEPADFAALGVREYAYTQEQAPFAVIGDFNQDGVADVALRVRSETATALVVVLSTGGAFKLVELKHAAWRAGAALPVLSASPAGAFREVGTHGVVDFVWSEDRFTRQVAGAAAAI